MGDKLLKSPKGGGLRYEPEPKTLYKTTTVRLTKSSFEALEKWAEACSDDTNNGSLNNLIQRILDWGIEHRAK